MSSVTAERGQASVELLAGVPALFLAGLIALQLLVVGYSVTLADGAAEAGAIAIAADRPARPAVRDHVEARLRARELVRQDDDVGERRVARAEGLAVAHDRARDESDRCFEPRTAAPSFRSRIV